MNNRGGFWENLAFTFIVGFMELGSFIGVFMFIIGLPIIFLVSR